MRGSLQRASGSWRSGRCGGRGRARPGSGRCCCRRGRASRASRGSPRRAPGPRRGGRASAPLRVVGGHVDEPVELAGDDGQARRRVGQLLRAAGRRSRTGSRAARTNGRILFLTSPRRRPRELPERLVDRLQLAGERPQVVQRRAEDARPARWSRSSATRVSLSVGPSSPVARCTSRSWLGDRAQRARSRRR